MRVFLEWTYHSTTRTKYYSDHLERQCQQYRNLFAIILQNVIFTPVDDNNNNLLQY